MTPTMTRRERERQRHRREILAVALDVFSRKGFEGTTMAEIAGQAEFAVGTLYKFFKDKEALYRALLLETAHEFERELFAALDAPGTEIEKLERFLEAKARMILRHIPAARLYFAQTTGTFISPIMGFDRELRALYAKLLDRLESVIRDGIRKKLLANVRPRALTLGLEGISNAFLTASIERPEEYSAEEMAALAKRIFFERVGLTGQ
jgi:TetR/AcrR family transcriptional regulator